MKNEGPIFLSASVPVEGRAGYDSADAHLIKMAIIEFIEVVLGRRLIVWGGHPAITPIFVNMSKRYELKFEYCTMLFQSKFFKGNYPNENKLCSNIIEVEKINKNRELSLQNMRKKMFEKFDYSAAVFVGGMEGVVQEFELFQQLNPDANLIPIPASGGVSRELYKRCQELPDKMKNAINFSFWYYKLLDIDFMEKRSNRDLTKLYLKD